LQIAQNQGVIKIDGLEMLVQQGAIALQSWLPEETIPVDIMQHTLREHLGWAS
ncbi:MAG: shikimate dehydrogenase, partial [Cyanobacteria bacterium J06639_18]